MPTIPNSPLQDWLALAGRVLVAWLFIPEGWGKVMHFADTAGYIGSQGIPFPQLATVAAIIGELGLGTLLLVGWQARWAALGLAIFVAVITPLFHNYWAMQGDVAMWQKLNFHKNLAILGGLLVLTAFGAGGLSADGRGKNKG